MSANTFGSRRPLVVGGGRHTIHALDALDGVGDVSRLPFSLKILLENLLRNEDGTSVTADDVTGLANWDATAEPDREIAFAPARILMQDFTGVPAVVDLAAMRDAMEQLGGDPASVNPLVPAELVIDHSVIVDRFGTPDAFAFNAELEFQRNQERYRFLRWGQGAFDGFRVVPPDTGICHQVNLEYLARVVFTADDGSAYPDTLVGTDSHTPMVNGLGVVGWGVGGIEAEAAMLGQPISMLVPRVVGLRLDGELPEGTTATDLVLTIAELLRSHGVVGKFVELYGPGVANVPLENRATIGNMSPEYGSTITIFPIDDETLRYLQLTGRPPEQVALVEAYAKEQGLWHEADHEPVFSERLHLDLSTIEPSLAGPARPQDRVALRDAPRRFASSLATLLPGAVSVPLPGHSPRLTDGGLDEASAESFPASDPPAAHGPTADTDAAPVNGTEADPEPPVPLHEPIEVDLADGTWTEIDHGHVVIAAITSCTNTSNPSVMLAAGLLAKKAVERGLTVAPWVKTSLAPGSRVVIDYYERAGLLPYLEKLGFHLVGYGCTTCIGNSGPVDPAIAAVSDRLALVSVLSGNRNFEGRINPDVRMNYLASPPLVVAYALAGTMQADLLAEPLGTGSDGTPVFLADLWPSPTEVADAVRDAVRSDMFRAAYGEVFDGDDRWNSLDVPDRPALRVGRQLHLRAPPALLRRHAGRARAAHRRARCPLPREARRQRHHGPHLPRRLHQGRRPRGTLAARARGGAGRLQLLRVTARQPRDHDPRHVRQHPAAQPARTRHRGRRHPAPAEWRRAEHLRRVGPLRIRGRAAGDPRGQGVRLRLVARLGGEGHRAARRPRRAGRELRAHPPVEPHRHGRAAAAVRDGRVGGVAGARGHGVVRRRRAGRPGRGRAAPPHPHRPRRRPRAPRRAPHRHPQGSRLLPPRRHPAVRAATTGTARLRTAPTATG